MRDINFRVYHKKEKKMYYPGQFRLKFNRDQKWYAITNPLKAPESPKSIEMMEYAGREDDNKKKVYEGDIVCFTDEFDVENIGEIKYIPEYMAFGIFDKHNDWNFIQNCPNDMTLEVIGNIWENKELLEGGEKK